MFIKYSLFCKGWGCRVFRSLVTDSSRLGLGRNFRRNDGVSRFLNEVYIFLVKGY